MKNKIVALTLAFVTLLTQTTFAKVQPYTDHALTEDDGKVTAVYTPNPHTLTVTGGYINHVESYDLKSVDNQDFTGPISSCKARELDTITVTPYWQLGPVDGEWHRITFQKYDRKRDSCLGIVPSGDFKTDWDSIRSHSSHDGLDPYDYESYTGVFNPRGGSSGDSDDTAIKVAALASFYGVSVSELATYYGLPGNGDGDAYFDWMIRRINHGRYLDGDPFGGDYDTQEYMAAKSYMESEAGTRIVEGEEGVKQYVTMPNKDANLIVGYIQRGVFQTNEWISEPHKADSALAFAFGNSFHDNGRWTGDSNAVPKNTKKNPNKHDTGKDFGDEGAITKNYGSVAESGSEIRAGKKNGLQDGGLANSVGTGSGGGDGNFYWNHIGLSSPYLDHDELHFFGNKTGAHIYKNGDSCSGKLIMGWQGTYTYTNGEVKSDPADTNKVHIYIRTKSNCPGVNATLEAPPVDGKYYHWSVGDITVDGGATYVPSNYALIKYTNTGAHWFDARAALDSTHVEDASFRNINQTTPPGTAPLNKPITLQTPAK